MSDELRDELRAFALAKVKTGFDWETDEAGFEPTLEDVVRKAVDGIMPQILREVAAAKAEQREADAVIARSLSSRQNGIGIAAAIRAAGADANVTNFD